jgi:ABC-type antimicrobial peptide transport system permease subunit
LEGQVDELLSNERLVARLSSILGLLAALLAAMGLYSVIAYSVARRTREIGLRMALGAGRAHIQWLVLREVLMLIGAGVALGVPAALVLTRLARNLLFGVEPNDPATLAGASLLMCAISLLAGYLPARRATRVDPMVALRCE